MIRNGNLWTCWPLWGAVNHLPHLPVKLTPWSSLSNSHFFWHWSTNQVLAPLLCAAQILKNYFRTLCTMFRRLCEKIPGRCQYRSPSAFCSRSPVAPSSPRTLTASMILPSPVGSLLQTQTRRRSWTCWSPPAAARESCSGEIPFGATLKSLAELHSASPRFPRQKLSPWKGWTLLKSSLSSSKEFQLFWRWFGNSLLTFLCRKILVLLKNSLRCQTTFWPFPHSLWTERCGLWPPPLETASWSQQTVSSPCQSGSWKKLCGFGFSLASRKIRSTSLVWHFSTSLS